MTRDLAPDVSFHPKIDIERTTAHVRACQVGLALLRYISSARATLRHFFEVRAVLAVLEV